MSPDRAGSHTQGVNLKLFVAAASLLVLGGCGSKSDPPSQGDTRPASQTLEGKYQLSLSEEEIKELGGTDKVPSLTLKKDGSWVMTSPPDEPSTGKYKLSGSELTLIGKDGEETRLSIDKDAKAITEAGVEEPESFVLVEGSK